MYVLLAIGIVGVVVSIYYYFGWIKAAFFEAWTPSNGPVVSAPARTVVGPGARLALGGLALATIFFGVYQGPLGAWLLAL